MMTITGGNPILYFLPFMDSFQRRKYPICGSLRLFINIYVHSSFCSGIENHLINTVSQQFHEPKLSALFPRNCQCGGSNMHSFGFCKHLYASIQQVLFGISRFSNHFFHGHFAHLLWLPLCILPKAFVVHRRSVLIETQWCEPCCSSQPNALSPLLQFFCRSADK